MTLTDSGPSARADAGEADATALGPDWQPGAGDCFPAAALEAAALLIGAMHDYGPDVVAGVLDPLNDAQTRVLACVLAAMVPADRSVAELLAWNDDFAPLPPTAQPAKVLDSRRAPGGRLLVLPCGTHAAYVRHKKRGERPCHRCRVAEAGYQRDHKRASRDRQRRAAA